MTFNKACATLFLIEEKIQIFFVNINEQFWLRVGSYHRVIFRTFGAYYFQNPWRLLFLEPLALIIFNIKVALSYDVFSNHILRLVFQRGEMVYN